MEANGITDNKIKKDSNFLSKYNSKVIGTVILGVSGISAVIAGLCTSYLAKKKNKEFLKELGKEQIPPVVLENPYMLGFRALAWGTVWAVGGCSLIVFGVWKWYGFKDFNDLKAKARSRIKKSDSETEGRTEFESLSDLLNYLNELSEKEDRAKASKTS